MGHETGQADVRIHRQLVAGFERLAEHARLAQVASDHGVLEHDVRPEHLPGARIREGRAVAAERRARRRRPANHVVAQITGIPVGIIRLNTDLDCVPEAGRLESLVPL